MTISQKTKDVLHFAGRLEETMWRELAAVSVALGFPKGTQERADADAEVEAMRVYRASFAAHLAQALGSNTLELA